MKSVAVSVWTSTCIHIQLDWEVTGNLPKSPKEIICEMEILQSMTVPEATMPGFICPANIQDRSRITLQTVDEDHIVVMSLNLTGFNQMFISKEYVI